MWTSLRVRGRAPYRARRLLLGALIAGAFPQPSFSLDFTKGVIDPRITCSGGVGGTVMNSSGNIVAASCPRFDYGNPRTNLLTWSSDLTNAGSWTKQAGNLVADSSIDPFGRSGVFLFTEDTTNTAHQIYTPYAAPSTTQNIAFSFYVKSNGIKQIEFGGNWQFTNCIIDLTTGAVTGSGVGLITVNNQGNGWFRIVFVTTAPDTASRTYVVRHVTSGTDVYKGDGVSGIYLCFPQLELGNTATTYIPTGATAVTVADPLGLLVEEQRTNLNGQSTKFAPWTLGGFTVTDSAVSAPDGTISGSSVLETATNAQHNINTPIPTTAGTAYTFSVYLQQVNGRQYAVVRMNDGISNANAVSVVINMSTWAIATAATAYGTFTNPFASAPVAVGNGWYRCTVTATTSATSTIIKIMTSDTGTLDANGQAVAFLGDTTKGVNCWGGQLEAGSFATSYIPTTTAAVTRTADSCSMTGANFSSWFNSAAGTFTWKFSTEFTGNAVNGGNALASSGTSSNIYAYIANNQNKINSYDGATSLVNTAVVTDGAFHKAALSYVQGIGRSLSVDGNAVVTGTISAAFTTGTNFYIGSLASSNYLNGHMQTLKYYKNQVPNNSLPRLTM
jgi:hypothetical protein